MGSGYWESKGHDGLTTGAERDGRGVGCQDNVVICGSQGFKVFVWRPTSLLDVRGVQDVELHEQWHGLDKAYGIAKVVAGLPRGDVPGLHREQRGDQLGVQWGRREGVNLGRQMDQGV